MSNAAVYTQSPFNKSRKDKFLMAFDLPKCFKNLESNFNRSNNTVIPDSIKFSVFGAVVPSVEIPPVDIRYAGQTLAASSHTRNVYAPNTVSFTVDNRFNNYWTIYSWLNILNHDKTGVYDVNNITSGRASNFEYRTNISIFALDEYNKRVVEFKYTDAFPTSLGGIEYSYRDGSEIESAFTYSYSQLLVSLVTSDIESF